MSMTLDVFFVKIKCQGSTIILQLCIKYSTRDLTWLKRTAELRSCNFGAAEIPRHSPIVVRCKMAHAHRHTFPPVTISRRSSQRPVLKIEPLATTTRVYGVWTGPTIRQFLKSSTRDKRRQGREPIRCQVRDATNIKRIPTSRFLSRDKTKADPTNYQLQRFRCTAVHKLAVRQFRRVIKIRLAAVSGWHDSQSDAVGSVGAARRSTATLTR